MDKMLNTRQLFYVITVANEKSFSVAARKLMISQPSLSQYIQKLEKEIGIELFERVTPLKLTYAGEIFLKSAQKMLATEEEMNRILRDIKDEKSGKIVIGTGYFNAMILLPHIIQLFLEEYPDIQIEVVERVEPELKELAGNGEVDLVIATQRIDDTAFQEIEFVQEEFLFAVPKMLIESMPSDKQPKELSYIDMGIFEEQPFVMLGTQVHMHRLLDQICKNNGFLPKKSVTCTSLNTAYSMVKAGIGVTIIPYSAYRYDRCREVVYFHIRNNDIMRDLNIYYKKERYLTKAMKGFIEVLQANVNADLRPPII